MALTAAESTPGESGAGLSAAVRGEFSAETAGLESGFENMGCPLTVE